MFWQRQTLPNAAEANSKRTNSHAGTATRPFAMHAAHHCLPQCFATNDLALLCATSEATLPQLSTSASYIMHPTAFHDAAQHKRVCRRRM